MTGGSGLIGHFLLQRLLQQGFEVVGLLRKTPSSVRHPLLKWVEGDILDSVLLRDIVSQVDEVYHCAGFVSYAPQDVNLLQQINVEGTENIVNACLMHPEVKLCHISSIAAISRKKGQEVIDESSKWESVAEKSSYAISKHFAEMEVWRGVAEGLKAVIVNPSIVLGPGDWNRSSTQLFKYVADERLFYVHGYSNFVDVRDVVEGIALLMKGNHFGERFIINGHHETYQNFFEEVANVWGKKSPKLKVPNWMTEILWRAEAVRGRVTGKRPLITKETARIAQERHFYTNLKVREATGMEFRPLHETIEWSCQSLSAQM